MALEIARRLVNGVWKTDAEDESTNGGSQPLGQEALQGNPVTVAGDGFARLTWNTVLSGDALLDRTNPAQPLVVAGGVYAVSANVFGTLADGANFDAILALDVNDTDVEFRVTSAYATTEYSQPHVVIAATLYIPAGGEIDIYVYNNDGAPADFILSSASVVRLTGPTP